MTGLSEIRYGGPGKPVDGYGPGFFRVGGELIRGAVLVSHQGFRGWGGIADHAAIEALAGQIDVLLVGTGATPAYVDAALQAVADRAGFGLEPMDSPAAARTYNMLLAEGRRVAAALIPV